MGSPRYIDMRGFLSFLILHELNSKKICGEDLAECIGNRKGGKLTPGTIYPALKALREQRLVKMQQNGRKKNYILTKKGQIELKSNYKEFSKLFRGLRSKIK